LTTGRWLPKERRTQNLVFLLLALALLILTFIGLFARGPYWNFYWPWETWPELPGRI
jgi:hypothetical protein